MKWIPIAFVIATSACSGAATPEETATTQQGVWCAYSFTPENMCGQGQGAGYQCHFTVPGSVFGASEDQQWVSGYCGTPDQPWGYSVLLPGPVNCRSMPPNNPCPIGDACMAVLPIDPAANVTGGPKYGRFTGVCGL